MTRVRWFAAVIVAGSSMGALVAACGMDVMSADEVPPSATRDASVDSSPGVEPPTKPIGVVLVHAASFPSFRLCFENYPERRPQPDSKIMPNANVVGVEVGSVVRIPPLERAPGRVYMIDRRVVEATPVDDELPCGALICDPNHGPPDDTCLRRRQDYDEATAIYRPLGTDAVELVAFTGCANGIVLENIGVRSSVCGDRWTFESGNLSATILSLPAEGESWAPSFSVQFVHLSPILELTRDGGPPFDVVFGSVGEAGGVDQVVAQAPRLFEPVSRARLDGYGEEQAFYGTHGFRVVERGERPNLDGGAGATMVEQSLAEIQDLSSPRDVPTEYYRTTSGYALLLLGDPGVTPTLEDGGPNPTYNARRGLHFLAVPIADPDGGAPADASTSAGGEP